MVEVFGKDRARLALLFDGWDETMVWSCLQGRMGRAWADRLEEPRSARLLAGDFCFFAGEPDRALVEALPRPLLQVPRDEGWAALIESVHEGCCKRLLRYAFEKDPSAFDRAQLEDYVRELPEGYRIEPIGEKLYHAALRASWSADLCANFPSAADFAREGLGFAVLHGETLCCGASSYTVYNGGIEIEIDTREDHRRKGLARSCAAALILCCLGRGLYPSWDAANLSSVGLAKQLGYRFSGEYTTYAVLPKGTK